MPFVNMFLIVVLLSSYNNYLQYITYQVTTTLLLSHLYTLGVSSIFVQESFGFSEPETNVIWISF
jgi:hypothetical protein